MVVGVDERAVDGAALGFVDGGGVGVDDGVGVEVAGGQRDGGSFVGAHGEGPGGGVDGFDGAGGAVGDPEPPGVAQGHDAVAGLEVAAADLEDRAFDVSVVEELAAGAVVEFVDVVPAHGDHEDAFAGVVGGEVVVHEVVAGGVGGGFGGDALVEFVEGECLVRRGLRGGG